MAQQLLTIMKCVMIDEITMPIEEFSNKATKVIVNRSNPGAKAWLARAQCK
ncbi:MAG: hypothetical protein L3J08_08895 [Flavobacteriaceae bacterium]|nr:hypothetical protein [Flavobacteriaceae bacterium]